MGCGPHQELSLHPTQTFSNVIFLSKTRQHFGSQNAKNTKKISHFECSPPPPSTPPPPPPPPPPHLMLPQPRGGGDWNFLSRLPYQQYTSVQSLIVTQYPLAKRLDIFLRSKKCTTVGIIFLQSKRSPDTRNAHTVRSMGANNEQPGKGGEGGPCGIRHADPSADTRRAGRERYGWCGGLRTVCGASFRVNPPPLHACARKGGKGSVGCRGMRMLRKSYYCIVCGSRRITEVRRDHMRLTLGAPMDRACVPAFRLLSLLDSELALKRHLRASRSEA